VKEPRTVTTIEIAGDEYTIRSGASRDYTLECARHVNETIREIMARGSLVEVHKAGILAALALADQLFQARAEMEAMRAELASRSARLVQEVEARLVPAGLASSE
jgi:cell division protein ZapA (FtsZ GTPase activity inhibitor)